MRNALYFFGLTTLLLSLTPLTAFGRGWKAKSSHETTGNQSGPQVSNLSYAGGKLRVDTPADNTSILVEVAAGKFTFIDHGRKQYSTITVEELVALRDKTLKQMREQLPSMPPAVRSTLEARLKEMEEQSKKSADLQLKPVGKKERIGKFECESFTWTASDGSGEACITKNVGVDLGDFLTASTKLGKRLAELGAGGNATNLAILQLASKGFPIRTRRKISFGTNELEVTETLSEIQAVDIPKADLEPPATYQKQNFEQMMAQSSGGGPSAPPSSAPPPSAPAAPLSPKKKP